MFSSQLISTLVVAYLAVATSALTLEARNVTASTIEARAPALPSGWKLTSACSTDDGKSRVFNGSGSLSLQRNVLNNNSPSACLSLCASNGYGYAALRLGTECWCGSSAPAIRSRPAKECDRHCRGDSKQTCGGGATSAVYTNSKLAGKKPKSSGTAKLTSGWSVAYKCIYDPTLGETLLQGTQVFEIQNNSPKACTSLCQNKGFSVAGVEYSNECMCGKNFKKNLHPEQLKKPASECSMACTGDDTVTCGSGHRVQLYTHKTFKRDGEDLVFDSA